MPEVYEIEKIIEAYDLLEYAVKYTNLEQRQPGDDEYWGICPNPQHCEKTASFSVNIEKNVYNCLGCHCHGNIINFVMMMEKDNYDNYLTFYKALEKLATNMNISKTEISSIQLVSKKFKIKKAKKPFLGHIELPEDVMGDKTEEIIEWINEGISPLIMNEFQVRRNKIQKDSIEFPIWDNYGHIISICRRTLLPDWKEKKLPKYIYYNKIKCLDFLYGWWQNKDFIQQKREIILFEGAKSVFKAIDYGYSNSCALLTSNMSPEQVQWIICNRIESVVFALDKGVSITCIRDMTELLQHYCKVYYIDGDDILDDKDSPVDKGKIVFDKLYQNKQRIV